MKNFYLKPPILLCLLAIGTFCNLAFSQSLATRGSHNPQEGWQKETITVEQLLEVLEENYDVSFHYETEIVRSVSLQKPGKDFQNRDLAELLGEVLEQTELSFRKLNEKYYLILLDTTPDKLPRQKIKKTSNENGLSHRQELPINSISRNRGANLVDQVIRGTVADAENGEPLPGVNVLAKGTTSGTVSNADGEFSLTVADNVTTLVFSSIGYNSQEVDINGRNTIAVNLAPDIKALSEVVVVGYGTQKRSDLTGSVASVSGEELDKLPITTVEQGLQGRAAGVQVTQADASPGGAVSVRIRGGNSINFSNEPLYVVDGFPTDNIASLNPNDIASMEVLKDASATAIYGARGANGVVIITTRQGKEGVSTLDFNMFVGSQEITNKIPLLNGVQYAELANEAYIQDGRDAPFPDPQALGEGTDWQDAVYRTAPIQNYQLAFTKGNKDTRYAITANYFNQDGIIINSNFERYSFRFNLDSDINERLTLGNNLAFSFIDNNEVLVNSGGTGGAGVAHNALTVTPDLPIYDSLGNYFVNWQQIGPGFRRDNPVSLAEDVTNNTKSGRFLGNFFVNYELAEGLSARISLGADIRYAKGNLYIPRTTYRGYFDNGIARVRNNQTFNWLNENILTYQKSFGVHSLNAVLGYTMQRENNEFAQAGGSNFVNDILEFNDISSASVLDPGRSAANQWSLQSYLARVNYVLSDKYLFTLSGRYDGSSRFGEANKFGFFPSGAVAWRMSEEAFIEDLQLFSDLKLRASYGITGNQEIPLYRSQSSLGIRQYIAGNALAIGIAPNRVANPDLRWERTAQLDIGLDFSFFNNRLRFTTDYYQKVTSDLLLEVSIPWTSGYSSSLQNVGSVENKGFELAIGANILEGDFQWNVEANYSQNRNKILSLGDEFDEFFGPTSGYNSFYSPGPAIILREGEPVNSFFGYVADGLFRTQEDIDNGPDQRFMELGDLRFEDLNGDGVLNADDRTIIGNAQPDFIYGITNNFSYKNFDLSIFIQGTQGNDVLNAYRLYELESMRGVHNNHIRVLDRWTPENVDAEMPKADRRGHERFVSTRGIEDASFVRLRNVVLGYNLPTNSIDWLSDLRVYVSGQNLLTITDYTGYDPEVNSFGQNPINQGIDYGAYPRARTFTAGLNVSF